MRVCVGCRFRIPGVDSQNWVQGLGFRISKRSSFNPTGRGLGGSLALFRASSFSFTLGVLGLRAV